MVHSMFFSILKAAKNLWRPITSRHIHHDNSCLVTDRDLNQFSISYPNIMLCLSISLLLYDCLVTVKAVPHECVRNSDWSTLDIGKRIFMKCTHICK